MLAANQIEEISHQDLLEDDRSLSCSVIRDIYLSMYPFIYFKIQSSASHLAKISHCAKTKFLWELNLILNKLHIEPNQNVTCAHLNIHASYT